MKLTNESWLARVLRYGVYASTFMPLVIFSQYISPFHFGKVVVFRAFVELLLVGYAALIIRDRSYLPSRNILTWSFLAFTLAFTLTTLMSVAPYQSLWGTLERMGGVWTFWHYFIFFIIATSVLRTREHWFRFLELTVAVGVLSAIYGFGQKTSIKFFIGSGGRERIFGTIGNAALFAGYEILNFFLALTLYLRPDNTPWKKKLLLATAALTGLAVFMTAVRGSLVGIVVGIITFLFLQFWKLHSQKAKKLLVAGMGALGIFVLGALIFHNVAFIENSRYLKRVTDFSGSSYTVKTRFWAWQAGLKGWSEGPRTVLVGWGPENFNIPFSKYFNPGFFRGPGSETLFDRAHNMFVEVLVTMGLVGFLTYIGMFAGLFWVLWKFLKSDTPDKIYAIGFIPLVIAYMIHNFFIFDTSANFLVFFSIFGFISFLYQQSRQSQETTLAPVFQRRRGLAVVAGGVLLIGAVVLIYKTDVVPAKANYASTRAIIRGWANDHAGAMAKYQEALAYNVPGKYDYRNRFAQYMLEYASQNKVTPEIAAEIQFAIEEMNKNADENPLDYLPHLYLSRLYITLGKDDPKSPYNDQALEHSLKALEISPTFVRTYYEVAQAYLNKKDFDKAIEYFHKAADLNPEVGISYWYWGLVEIDGGNIKDGLTLTNQAIEKGYELIQPELDRLTSMYVTKLKDYRGLSVMYEKLVTLVPQKAPYHASLAVAYAQIGNIDGAVTQAHEAARLDPAFENDARAFVQSLGRQW